MTNFGVYDAAHRILQILVSSRCGCCLGVNQVELTVVQDLLCSFQNY